MPISIVSQPGTTLGPGVGLNLRTDTVGPVGANWFWRISVIRPTDEQNVVVIQAPIWAADQHQVQVQFDASPLPGQTTNYARYVSVNTNDQVNLISELVDADGTTIHDSGAHGSFRWDSSTSASRLLDTSAGGGLTNEQATQLADTERRTRAIGEPTDLTVVTPSGPVLTTLGQIFSRSTLDRLTLAEVTDGETCAPVRADFSSWYSSVIVRVTQIDPELTPKTPDLEWYFPDLAVLRIFRGSDLLFRRGIHTPTFIQESPEEWGWWILRTTEILGVPPQCTIAVDWRPGCCGRVYLRFLP